MSVDKKYKALSEIVKSAHDIEVYKLSIEVNKNTWIRTVLASPLTPVILTALFGIFTAYKAVENEKKKQQKEIVINSIVRGDSVQTSKNLKFFYQQGMLDSDVSLDDQVYKVDLSNNSDSIQKFIEGNWKLVSMRDKKGNAITSNLKDSIILRFKLEYRFGGSVNALNSPYFVDPDTVFTIEGSKVSCNHFDLVDGKLNVNGFSPKVISLTNSELVLDGMIPCLFGAGSNLFNNSGGMIIVFSKIK